MSTVLVTGCSRGLGLHLARVLASSPVSEVSLVLAATRSETPTPNLQELLTTSGGRVRHVTIDIVSSTSIQAAVPVIQALLGEKGLDYLFNNAAVRDPVPVTNLENVDFLSESLMTNVVGTHQVTCAFLPLLRRGTAKKIVNFSSTLGQLTTAQTNPSMSNVPLPAYKISKAGLHMLTALWSNQLKREGFCVYLQSPGNLKTDLAGGDRADLPIVVGAKETVRIAFEASPEDSGRHRNIMVEGWEQGGGIGGRYDGLDLPW